MIGRFGDPADSLPDAAKARLIALRQSAADAGILANSMTEALQDAHLQRLELNARIKRLTQPVSASGYGLKPDDPQVAEVQARLDKANAEHVRLTELSEVRYSTRSTLQRLVENIEAWLMNGRPEGTALATFERETPTLKKNESLFDAIESKRRRLRELRADAHRVRSAPYPSALAKAKARAQIDALADRGAPSVLGLIENLDEIVFPTLSMMSLVRNAPSLIADGPAATFTDVPDAIGLLAWTFKSALIAALDKEISDCSDDSAALTDEQRQKQEATLLQDVLATEREEVSLIDLAMTQGINVAFRDDISPPAILGVQLITAPASAPSDDGNWVNHLLGKRS